MATKTLDFGFELKSINDDGTFDGYGSVFGNKDSYDEIVAPGAFAESLASGRMPAMLWQHRASEPVGVYTGVNEDSIGLKVSGRLALKTARGAEAHELMKMKAITGLSIGFTTREDSFDRVTGIRTLKKVDLWEVSLVTFPANDASRIQNVKSIETITSIRDAEEYLRDAGMSRSQSVAFISRVKSLGRSDSDDGDMQQIIKALKHNANILTATQGA